MLLLFIVITLFVLAMIWYYPTTTKENYAPPSRANLNTISKKGGPGQKIGGGGPKIGSAPSKETQLTPETLITLPLGILIQYLDKSGTGSVSG
jgi:hypothetical protein